MQLKSASSSMFRGRRCSFQCLQAEGEYFAGLNGCFLPAMWLIFFVSMGRDFL